MLFKGTQRRTAAQIAAEMDAIGGNLNAFTAKECTCFYAKVLDEHLPRAADMLSDLVRNSKFDEADIEREKGVVCEEILMTEDSPEDVAHETLCALLYENAPLAKPILGTQESVRAFTRDTLMNYMTKHYVPGNIVISCAGHFERAALMDTLNRYFLGGSIETPVPKHPRSARPCLFGVFLPIFLHRYGVFCTICWNGRRDCGTGDSLDLGRIGKTAAWRLNGRRIHPQQGAA